MDNFIFDKTDKGREEIVTRKYRLASRLRSLLVLIDGKKNALELLQKVSGLGLDIQSLTELVDGEFIESVGIAPTIPGAAPMSAPIPASANNTGSNNVVRPTQQPPNNPKSNGVMGATQMLALQNFFNETIKSTIGLRGFTLQLKVERAATLADFRSLREPYLAAVQKAKGSEMALSLQSRLDQLLDEAEQSAA
jgi:hypothetical protein